MSRGSNTAKLNQDITSEVIDTPDIQAYRSWDPTAEMDRLNRTLAARNASLKRDVTEGYGRYSGIPSAVTRNRLRDLALADIDENDSLALAEGANRANEMRGNQLSTLAALTAKRRQSGYQESFKPQGGGGIGSALIGAGATVGVAL